MNGGKKDLPMTSLVQRAFQASLLILATVFILDLSIGYLQKILPWIVGAVAVALGVWVVVAVVRWRRSKW